MFGTDFLSDRPLLAEAVHTAVIVGAAYLIGHLLKLLFTGRLARLANRTTSDWDDVLVRELKRRVPFWTVLAGASFAIGSWGLSPENLAFGRTVIRALGIAWFTVGLSSVLTQLVVARSQRLAPKLPVSALSQSLVRLLCFILGGLAIARGFGFEVGPYLGVLGVGGLAIGLALQDPLSNLFGGILMGVSNHVKLGDYVRVDPNVEGYVLNIDWRTTIVRTLSNNIISVPNSKVAQAVITNYSEPSPEIALNVDVVVDYGSDLAAVERAAVDVGRSVMAEVPGGVPNADVQIRFTAFGDSGIGFSLGSRARSLPDQALVRHELIRRLHARFAADGIALGRPTRNLVTSDPLRVEVKS